MSHIPGLRFLGKFEGDPNVGTLTRVLRVVENSAVFWKTDEEGKTFVERSGYVNIGADRWKEFWADRGVNREAGDLTGDGVADEEDRDLINALNEEGELARAAWEAKE